MTGLTGGTGYLGRHIVRALALDEAAAGQTFAVRRYLEQTGREVGHVDLLIGMQPIAINLRPFLCISDLAIEN